MPLEYEFKMPSRLRWHLHTPFEVARFKSMSQKFVAVETHPDKFRILFPARQGEDANIRASGTDFCQSGYKVTWALLLSNGQINTLIEIWGAKWSRLR